MSAKSIIRKIIASHLLSFSFLITLGGIVSLINDYQTKTLLETILALFFFGIAPIPITIYMLIKRDKKRESGVDQISLLNHAIKLGGKLTVIDVAMLYNISIDKAKSIIEDLSIRGIVTPEISEKGGIVYNFYSISTEKDKIEAKGVEYI